MDLQGIPPRERSQSQMVTYSVAPFIEQSPCDQMTETWKREEEPEAETREGGGDRIGGAGDSPLGCAVCMVTAVRVTNLHRVKCSRTKVKQSQTKIKPHERVRKLVKPKPSLWSSSL